MFSIRELWNSQADGWNQFDELGLDEIEDFVNELVESLYNKIEELNKLLEKSEENS